METQNVETQNVETQNVETQNVETQNVETQNVETQNVEIEKEISMSINSDITREEMKWNENIESFLLEISQRCKEKSNKQQNCYKKNKILYLLITIPSVMIPIITSTLESNVLQGHPYVVTYLILLSGLLSGVNSIFNFNTRFFNNSIYDDKYSELASEIELELIKDRNVRRQSDVFLQKISDDFNRINENAPKS